MARDLLDLLWRVDGPAAPAPARGPRPKVSTAQTVAAATALADEHGLGAVSVRRLAARLGVAPTAVYTHVGSRDDLLVLMADALRSRRPPPALTSTSWRGRVRQVAEAELALHTTHPWLLDVADPRTAFGPGTIGTYDAQLRAFDATGLDDVGRDAALTFVLDFVRAAARARLAAAHAADMEVAWSAWGARLAGHVGERYPLARRVGRAAGEAMRGPYSAEHAWRFGLDRVLDGLATRIDAAPAPR